GIRALGVHADVVVLTDADVVLGDDALLALERAFAREPRLLLASGAPVHVRTFAPDGQPLGRAADVYDCATALVRRLESRCGKLVSVPGQLLAWRTAAGLAPTPGRAADDLDLCFAARARGAHVRLVPRARFYEQKTPRGPAADEQSVRRARAW